MDGVEATPAPVETGAATPTTAEPVATTADTEAVQAEPVQENISVSNPNDLETAFMSINQEEQQGTTETVSQDGNAGQVRETNQQQQQDQSTQERSTIFDKREPVQREPGQGLEEHKTNTQAGEDEQTAQINSFKQYLNGVENEIQDIAERFTADQMKKNNRFVPTPNDLVMKDEINDRMVFRNPFDQNNPFTSLTEAQQACDAIAIEYEREANAIKEKALDTLRNEKMPQVQLEAYKPLYNALSDNEKAIVNRLAEPYARKDRQGHIVFDCDLRQLTNQAREINKMYAGQIRQQQVQQQPRTTPGNAPVLDANTSGASQTQANRISTEDVKTLTDAFISNYQDKNERGL